MVTDELKDYVEKELGRGVTKNDIKRTLLGAGWELTDIEQVLNPKFADSKVNNASFSVSNKDNHVIMGDGTSADTPKSSRGIRKWLVIVLVFLLLLIIAGGVGGYVYYLQ